MPLDVLRIVKTALIAQRAALEVVTQNISNAATPGYTTQRPVLEPLAVVSPTQKARSGHGVRLAHVQRLHDAYLAAQVDYQQGLYSYAETCAFHLERIEGLLGGLEQGLHARLGEFFNAWQELGADASNMAARRNAVAASKNLAAAIREYTSKLRQLQSELNQSLADAVSRANALIDRIARLNGQVMAGEGTVGGNTAAAQRDAALEELAKLTGATVLPEDSGSVAVLIGGLKVVSYTHADRLELAPDAADPSKVNVVAQGRTNPSGLTGTIGALLNLRDRIIPGYLARLDSFAMALADAVNAQHAAGFDDYGNPGADLFTYNPTWPAGTLAVSDAIDSDPRLLAASSAAGPTSDGGNAFAIAGLRYRELADGMTPEQLLADIIAQIGADTRAAQENAKTRQNLADALKAKYEEKFGVSVDEQSVLLMQFQRAFMASARIAQVVDEMMDAIFAIGG